MLGRLRIAPVLVFLSLPAWADNVVSVPVANPAGAPVFFVGPANAVSGNLGTARSQGSASSLLGGGVHELTLRKRIQSAFDGRADDPKGNVRPVVPPAPIAPVPAPASGLTETGRALLDRLHELTGRGFIQHSYDTARRFMFSTADNVIRNGVRGVVDAYSGVFVPGRGDEGHDYPERGDQNGDGRVDREGMNAEHVWPQSFFESHAPMRSDLHHLMPTFIWPNEVRGHLPFGEVQGRPEYSNNGGAKMGGGVFEPPDAAKGRIARAVLYFFTRYNDHGITRGDFSANFFDNRLEMFLRWNREHPPTAEEKQRNDRIEQFQGNRNPFIDDPTLADRIGVDGFRSGYQGRYGRPQDSRPYTFRSDRQRRPRRHR